MQPTSCTDIINQQLTCGPSALHLPIQLPHTKQRHSFQRRPQFFNLQGIRYRSHYRHQAVFVQPVQRQNGTTDFTYNKLTFRLGTAGLTYLLSSATNTGDPLSTLVRCHPFYPLARHKVTCHGWYHKWSLTICDGCFDTLKSSKMRS